MSTDSVDLATATAPARSISWDDLVGAALLGTTRRTVDTTALAGPIGSAAATLAEPDPAARLLDAAAMITVYRRAGLRSTKITTTLSPAGPESARPTPSAAADRLGELVEPSGQTSLIPEWLQAAASVGVVAPPALLPALLDLAVRRTELVDAICAVLGERGRWLADRRPDWAAAVRPSIAATLPSTGASAEPATSPVWSHGTAAERRSWFASLRTADPAAAATLLADLDWRRERGEDRLAYVQALRIGLSAADVPVLELARADRRQDVRTAATELLVDLPESAYAITLTVLASSCVHVERRAMRRTIVVTLPDPEVVDLGDLTSGSGSPSGGAAAGPGARLVSWLLSRVALTEWERSLGAKPAELVDLPVADDLGSLVHDAWAAAAARQLNSTWAEALAPVLGVDRLAELLPAFVPERRAAVVASALDALTNDQRPQREPVIMTLLRALDRPWSEDVTDAFVRWLSSRDAKTVPYPARGVVELAGRSLRPDRGTAVKIASALGRHPDGSPWRTVIHALADVLLFRHQMLEELR